MYVHDRVDDEAGLIKMSAPMAGNAPCEQLKNNWLGKIGRIQACSHDKAKRHIHQEGNLVICPRKT